MKSDHYFEMLSSYCYKTIQNKGIFSLKHYGNLVKVNKDKIRILVFLILILVFYFKSVIFLYFYIVISLVVQKIIFDLQVVMNIANGGQADSHHNLMLM